MLPFIKLFNCKAGYFLYDVNKNDIVELSKLEYKFILSKMIKNQNGEHFVIDDEFERLKELKKSDSLVKVDRQKLSMNYRHILKII